MKMAVVEVIDIARRVAAVINTIGTKIGNGVAAGSKAENTKSQADIAVEVEDGLVQNRIIHHLTTIRDLDPDHLPIKRNGRSQNIDIDVTVAIEKTTVEVVVGAVVTVVISTVMEGAQHLLLLHSTT